MLTYDEEKLLRELSGMSTSRRTAYAAAAAQRLFPALAGASEAVANGDAVIALRKALERTWEHALGKRMTDAEIEMAHGVCESLLPPEHEGVWTFARAYAEDAVAAIQYAVRTAERGDPQEAAWAARCAYESADYYVVNEVGIEDETQILAHPHVQHELARQVRDIEQLATLADEASAIALVRDRAIAEAAERMAKR